MTVALASPVDGRLDADAGTAGDRRAAAIFLHGGMIGCICLQRFCVYAGGSPIYLCLPIFLGLLLWLLATGRAEFRPLSTALYTLFAATGLVAALLAINLPDPRITGLSVLSLFSLLLIYAGLLLRPTPRFDASRSLAIFIFYVRLCALLGIAQYLLQFAGLRLFSFMSVLPALKPVLVEPLFNHTPVVSYGSAILRSNGFFLIEPSTFSQLLMLGVIVDVFHRGQWRWLPVYGVAYIFTYAGTGLLALALALLLYLPLAARHAGRLLGFGIAGLLLATAVALAFPEQFGALAGRAGELGATGSSGYARYMTQFDVIAQVWGETRTLIGFGPGAFDRATFHMAGGGNPALKLFIEYGVIGLLAFAAFLIGTLWRRDMALVALFTLINYQLGGGNLLFAPLVVLAALLCIWSAPSDDMARTKAPA